MNGKPSDGEATRAGRAGIGQIVEKYRGKPWTREMKARIEAEVGAALDEKVVAYRETDGTITVRPMAEMNLPGVVVPEEDPSLQTVMVELVRAQSALNSPSPEEAFPEMVKDAYLHIGEALRQLDIVTSGRA